MTDDERRDQFRATVQAGAIVIAIQDGRGVGAVTDTVSFAWTVPGRALVGDVADAALEYLEWQLRGNSRPDWCVN